ncbi:MAG: bile acid:sodium symporter family protein [Succinivibrio sp.]|nr:bile acid:sodium symporter family protein [Succinivibrio sp.]
MLHKVAVLSAFVGRTFALWVIVFAVLAYMFPELFRFLSAYISILLGIVMFGMGLTLKPKDFSEVFTRPIDVLIGVAGQFIIMPVLAYALAKILNLPSEIAVGVILVGCCPGGTSSNVMSYLSKGDVPLSVTITACSTVLAPFVTPALIYLFANQWVEINAATMVISIVKIVIVPIVGGVVLNMLFGRTIARVVVVLPLVSSVAIISIVAAVVAVSQQKIAQTGALIFSVVVLHNFLGYLLGYLLGRVFKMDLAKRKTLSIEIGMQNSGLGVALAMAHFSPLSAVPAAIFSVWHNITGGILSSVYARMSSDQEQSKENREVRA